MIESLTSQLDESNDKLSHSSSLKQQLENQLQGTEANNTSLTSQLNEARNQLSEVGKNYKLLSGDHEALSNISLEQCDELIMKWNRSGEKLLQRRVSNETYL
jgi:septal ring factor EnvC (AmiA/AmiB activator)